MSPRRHRRLCEWAYLFLFPLVAITTAIGCGGGDDDDENETDDDAIDDDSIDDDTGDDDVADDDTTDDDTMDDDTFDDDATDDDTGDDDTDDTFVNFFLSDADTGEEIEGATCTLVDPVSGEPDDPAIEELSDADGVCAFVLDGDPAQVSVRFEWADYVTIYRFYVETNSVVDQIMVSEALRDT
ncbi:MAG: hypothetical protein KJ042_15005, partial [Deltaproteobacteria bacterium]|nr:hypothetical protein [Deltaproteobacteria bacterium]